MGVERTVANKGVLYGIGFAFRSLNCTSIYGPVSPLRILCMDKMGKGGNTYGRVCNTCA